MVLAMTVVSSQEICDNALDDDADGLVDIQDPDCACFGFPVNPVDVTDKVPNPGFEEMDCCPDWLSQVTECLAGWVEPTLATPDYQNTCDFVMDAVYTAGLYPFPSGEGVVGLLIGQNWREGIGTCLNSPLEAGKQYTFEIQMAFVPIVMSQQQGYPECEDPPPYPPINFAVFGNSSCNAFNMNGTQCPPSIDASWTALGEAVYAPSPDWETLSITFTPTTDIAAIIFSTACQIPPQYTTPPCSPYFFIDDITLVEYEMGGEIEIELSGNPCEDDLVLSASADPPGGEFQWYFQGQAIVGETGSILQIPASDYHPGTYTVTYSLNGDCLMDSIALTWILPQPTSDTLWICAGETATCAGESFEVPGVYEFVFVDPDGCDSVHTCVILQFPDIPVMVQQVDLCGPASVSICGESFSESGHHTITCEGSTGCDSLIELDLRILEPLSSIAAADDLPCGGVGSVILDGSMSTVNPFAGGGTSYVWTGPVGGIKGPDTENQVEVILPGTYCLEVVHTLPGATCSDISCVSVDVSQGPPPTPAISGPGAICLLDTLVLAAVPSDTLLVAQWFLPSGLSLLEQNSTQIRLTANGAGFYQICMDLNYPCGVSDTTCVTIQVLAHDSIEVIQSTCEPKQVGMDTVFFQNQFGCDSLVITTTSLLPSHNIIQTFYTCDPAQAGLDTVYLTNQYGCDSTLYIERIYTGNYQETNHTLICGSGINYADTLLITTGPCDSLFITNYMYAPLDTTWLSGTTCDPAQAGISIAVQPSSLGCDSTIITTTSLLPSDSTLVSGVTCDPAGAMYSITVLSNQYGCDSVVTTDIQYVGIDTLYVEKTTCEPSHVGTVVSILPGVDCDTVLVTETTYVPFTQSEETIIVCGQSGVLSDTTYLQNAAGCDSLVIRNYEYVSLSSQYQIQGETCAGDQDGSIELTSVVGGVPPYEGILIGGNWQSATLFDNLPPGQYTLVIRDAAGCLDTLFGLVVTPGATVAIDAGPDRTAAPGEVIDLSAQTTQSLAQVQWTATDPLSCPGCLQTTLGPLTTNQTVIVTGWTQEGCSDTDALEVILKTRGNIFIPNSFTPNNDGINDVFSVYGNDQVLQVRNLAIFDRWGNALYSRSDLPINDPSAGWDGTFRDEVMDPGVYVYVVEVELVDGSVRLFKGDVTLVR